MIWRVLLFCLLGADLAVGSFVPTGAAWDPCGSSIRLTGVAGNYSLRSYDAAGNQIILTNRNGNKWQFYFDAANRLTGTFSPLSRSNSRELSRC
jgi:YD repeat-containing protein